MNILHLYYGKWSSLLFSSDRLNFKLQNVNRWKQKDGYFHLALSGLLCAMECVWESEVFIAPWSFAISDQFAWSYWGVIHPLGALLLPYQSLGFTQPAPATIICSSNKDTGFWQLNTLKHPSLIHSLTHPSVHGWHTYQLVYGITNPVMVNIMIILQTKSQRHGNDIAD